MAHFAIAAAATALCRRVCRVRPPLIIEPAGEQPADAKHIGGGAEGAVAEAVFALTELAWAMVHRDFHEAIAGAFHERGNEAMHPFERKQRADAFTPHGLQSAAGIADSVFRKTAPDEVRDAAGDPFHERVLALRAITTDEVGPALDLGEQFRNVRGIVLQIAIDQNGRGATRALQAGIHGRALAGIALELHQTDLRFESDPLNRSIDRAVIDKNDFVIEPA